MEITKLDLKSENIVQDNINQLKQLFPEAISEGKIDFHKLREILGEEIEDNDEKYEFTWNGKHDAIRDIQKRITKTLRPYKNESKNWSSTKNLYIEGDNLNVLKLLQKSYQNKIKMMYIDPPYNTGKDSFIYKDKFQESEEEFKNNEENEGKFQSNSDTSGKYHTNWLNMMYPRLKLSRNLLTEEGIIFISIDDNEIYNLMKICNEIYGEENTELMIWDKVSSNTNAGTGKMKITHRFRKDHEYILVCYKNKNITTLNKPLRIKTTKNEYGNQDNDPRGNWISSEICKSEAKSNPNGKNYYTITTPTGKKIQRQWHYSYDELKKLDEDNRIYWGNGNIIPRLKKFVNEPRPTTPSSVITGISQTEGNNDLKKLKITFDNPKPINLIKWLIEISVNENDIILDFFSGSSSTAEAIMNLNITSNSNNKFIMIQYPEPCDEDSNSFKEGYKNICEIGKERIKRSGNKLLEEHPDNEIDIGFKVLKEDSSNFKEWNPTDSPLEEYIDNSIINIKSDRSELDLIYEIMLKYGIELTADIKEVKKSKYNFYSIGYGALIVCLNDEINEDVTEDILEIIEDNVEIIDNKGSKKNRIVFKETSLLNDSVKTNIIQILKNNNIEDIITY